MATKLVECPRCLGLSNLTINATSDFPTYEIECYACKGAGKVSKDSAERINAYKNDWCKCEDQFLSTTHHKHGEHPKLKAEHWRCSDCRCVVKIDEQKGYHGDH